MSHAFICHASEDEVFAREVAGKLKDRSLATWMAPDDVPLGAAFNREIAQAIRTAVALVFVYTPSSSVSEFCQSEIVAAKKARVPIIVLRMTGEPLPEELDLLVNLAQWLDATGEDDADWPDRLARRLERMLADAGQGPPAREVASGTRRPVVPALQHTTSGLVRSSADSRMSNGSLLFSVGEVLLVARMSGSAVRMEPFDAGRTDLCGVGFTIGKLVASADGSTLLAVGTNRARLLRVSPDGAVDIRTDDFEWPEGVRPLAAWRDHADLRIAADHVDGARLIHIRATKAARVQGTERIGAPVVDACFLGPSATFVQHDGAIVGSDTDELVDVHASSIDAAVSGGRTTVAAIVQRRSGTGKDLLVRSSSGAAPLVSRIALEGAPEEVMVERPAGGVGEPTVVAVCYADDRCERWEVAT